MYLNSCFLGAKYRKSKKVLITKTFFFDTVRVWIHLTVSKLDSNVLVIHTMHFGRGITCVSRDITLTTLIEIGVLLFHYLYK
jgi:hypothetical protein